MAVAMVRYYLQKGTHKGLYRNIARTLKFFQTFALLEVSSAAFNPHYDINMHFILLQFCSIILCIG